MSTEKGPDLHDALKETVLTLAEYFYTEMGWENFRAEFLADYGSKQRRIYYENARQIFLLLERQAARSPEIAELLREARER